MFFQEGSDGKGRIVGLQLRSIEEVSYVATRGNGSAEGTDKIKALLREYEDMCFKNHEGYLHVGVTTAKFL